MVGHGKYQIRPRTKTLQLSGVHLLDDVHARGRGHPFPGVHPAVHEELRFVILRFALDLKRGETSIILETSYNTVCPFSAHSATPRKYVSDATSICQRSSSWTGNSVNVEMNIISSLSSIFPVNSLFCKKKNALTTVSESIEAKYCVS